MKRVVDWLQNFQIICAVLLVVVCLAGLPFGIKPYIVLSGSMEPEIHVGSLAYVDRGAIPRENFIQGDVIAFKVNSSTIVSHRIVKNDSENKLITTKGDANNSADRAPVPYENVVGETIFSVPYLGYVLMFLKNHWLLFLITIALFNLVLHLLSLLSSKSEDEEKQQEKVSENEWSNKVKTQNQNA